MAVCVVSTGLRIWFDGVLVVDVSAAITATVSATVRGVTAGPHRCACPACAVPCSSPCHTVYMRVCVYVCVCGCGWHSFVMEYYQNWGNLALSVKVGVNGQAGVALDSSMFVNQQLTGNYYWGFPGYLNSFPVGLAATLPKCTLPETVIGFTGTSYAVPSILSRCLTQYWCVGALHGTLAQQRTWDVLSDAGCSCCHVLCVGIFGATGPH